MNQTPIQAVAILLSAVAITLMPVVAQAKTIIGYYASWQWYDRNQKAAPSNMDFTKLDRVNFAFFQTDTSGNLWGTDSWADPQLLFGPYDYNPPGDSPKYCSWDAANVKNCNHHKYEQGLINLVHQAGAEIYPSIGGWTLSKTFPAMAASADARTNFANQCVNMIQDYGFDGIDIDWEYPGYVEHNGTPQDELNFSLLLEEVKSKLTDLSQVTGKTYGLTAALPCGPSNIANIDVPRVSLALTELNLMSYDFHGPWDSTTGVNSPLYDQGFGTADLSVHDCVSNWLSAGASLENMNIGLAFYGRSFAQATELNQAHGGADTINWQIDEGSPLYYNIMSKISSMTSVRHEPSKTQYAYFSSGGLVSYDDEAAICDKTRYVMDNNLNGFIIWELSGDLMGDLSTPLLDMVNKKLVDSSIRCGSFSTEVTPTAPSPAAPTAPGPTPTQPTPATMPTPINTACGDGNRGDGVCLNGQCCSQWGWCGTSSEHCTTGGSAPNTTPITSPSPGSCGDGNRGDGVCLNGQCCSQWGWCGTSSEHCK